MTMTTRQLHIHLQEMDKRYKKENPNLTIHRIAKDFGATIEALQPHLDRLESLGLISYAGKHKESVKLTKNGTKFSPDL